MKNMVVRTKLYYVYKIICPLVINILCKSLFPFGIVNFLTSDIKTELFALYLSKRHVNALRMQKCVIKCIQKIVEKLLSTYKALYICVWMRESGWIDTDVEVQNGYIHLQFTHTKHEKVFH